MAPLCPLCLSVYSVIRASTTIHRVAGDLSKRGGQSDIHPIQNAALVWEGGTLLWVGPEKALPAEYAAWESWDADGALVIPGLIDCHTHLAFGGWRAEEFEQRIQGSSYLDIARRGGGIMSTVAQTRTMSEDALLDRARGFLERMMALGVTTVECKSGYGLDVETELRLLRVYHRLGQEGAARIIPTFLGAHVVPPEFRDQREDYIKLLIERADSAHHGAGLGAVLRRLRRRDCLHRTRRLDAFFRPGKRRGWEPSSMPTSSVRAGVPSSQPNWERCRRIISSVYRRPALPRWQSPDPLR